MILSYIVLLLVRMLAIKFKKMEEIRVEIDKLVIIQIFYL